jgi:hypothetical protein
MALAVEGDRFNLDAKWVPWMGPLFSDIFGLNIVEQVSHEAEDFLLGLSHVHRDGLIFCRG